MTTVLGNDVYFEWVREEAGVIKSDGCTVVAQIRVPCCHEHDLGYYHGRDVREAYRRFRQGYPDYWGAAAKTTRGAVDARFRSCIQSFSPVGAGSPLALVRWVGVRLGGWLAWRKHRALRP